MRLIRIGAIGSERPGAVTDDERYIDRSDVVQDFKALNTLIGPNDDVVIPKDSTKTDWEVELGIVIGMGSKPPIFLKGGETMVLTVSHLGTQTQHVHAYEERKSS